MCFFTKIYFCGSFFCHFGQTKRDQVSFRFEGDLYHSNDAETIEHA